MYLTDCLGLCNPESCKGYRLTCRHYSLLIENYEVSHATAQLDLAAEVAQLFDLCSGKIVR